MAGNISDEGKESNYPSGADHPTVAADPGGAGERKAEAGHNETIKNKRERIREPDSHKI